MTPANNITNEKPVYYSSKSSAHIHKPRVSDEALDDRHAIRSPLISTGNSVEIWAQTVKARRVDDLTLTREGFIGHITQIQCEIARTSPDKLEGVSGEHVQKILEMHRYILHAATEHIKAGVARGMVPEEGWKLEFPLLHQTITPHSVRIKK